MHIDHLIVVMLRAISSGHPNVAAMIARRIYRELRALNLDVASPYWTEHVHGTATVIFAVSDYWPNRSAPGIH